MRRDGDSNPGYAFDVYTLSRRASSVRVFYEYLGILFADFALQNYALSAEKVQLVVLFYIKF